MKNKNEKIIFSGSAIVYALVILTVVSILFSSMIVFVNSQLKYSLNRVDREQAFQIAEAGIYYYRWYLAHATDGMNTQQLESFWTDNSTIGVSEPYEADYNDPETGEIVGGYRLTLTPPAAGSTIAHITSVGWSSGAPNSVRTIKTRFRRPSWSEYIYLVNDFVNFGTGATVYGKVHSNTGVRFDGIAYNSVTSYVPSFDDPSHSGSTLEFGVHTHRNPVDPNAPTYPWADGTVPNRSDVFVGGRQFPVPMVSFQGIVSDLANIKQQASGGNGRYFDNAGYGRRIILKSDGNFDVCTVNAYNTTTLAITSYLRTGGSGTCSSCSGLCLDTQNIPDGGVIFVEDNTWVEGTLNDKKVTIVAANLSGSGSLADIYLGYHSTANLLYTNTDGRDILGLIGQRSVRIGRDCPNNFTIYGALLAQDQTGKVYRKSESYGGYNKNSLTVNGAIASYGQPYFNSGSNGFTTRTYNFDNNLLYYPPPYFPTGTEYAIDLWEEL